MGSPSITFDDWFEQVCDLLADDGIHFNDPDSVQQDYENGLSIFDAVDQIKQDR